MDYELTFCKEHSGRTCCSSEDTNKIRAKVGLLKYKSDLSEKCFNFSNRVLCSYCDGDIGVGTKDSLCIDWCTEWYYSCKDDFLDPYINVHDNLPFCLRDSLVCSKVTQVVDSPQEFCEHMGFKVANNQDQKACYSGIPSASIHGSLKATRPPQPPQQESENVEWQQKLMQLIDKYPMLIKLIQAVELIVVFGGGYLLYLNIQYCCCRKKHHKRASIADRKHIQELHQKRLNKAKQKKEEKGSKQ